MAEPIATWFFPLVPYWTPNKLRGKHWRTAKRNADEWRFNVTAICGRAKVPCKTRRRLEVTTSRPRRLDPDGEKLALKPVVDALKGLGWIRNDSCRWLEYPAPEQLIGHPSLKLVLSEAEPETKRRFAP